MKPKSYSKCHPEKGNYAHGICKECYDKQYYKEKQKPFVITHKNRDAVCHPGRKNYSHGKCKICYQKNYRSPNPLIKEQKRLYHKIWIKNNPDKPQQYSHKRDFGLSSNDYALMVHQQGNKCAICHNQCSTGKRLAVDHNHQTGQIRGLLCTKCNLRIGILENLKWMEKAEEYLNNPPFNFPGKIGTRDRKNQNITPESLIVYLLREEEKLYGI